MTDDGFQFDSADHAIARARIAGRKLTEAGPQLTPENVDEGAQVVEKLAAEAHALATDLPRRAATLKNRIPSLVDPDRRAGDEGQDRPRGAASPTPRVLGRELAGS